MPQRKLGPDSRDRAARMRSLVAAALELFAEAGYANVSTRRIADRAGCSETLLFRYFGGKRGLLLAIVDEFGLVPPGEPYGVSVDRDSLADLVESHILLVCETMGARSRESRVLIAELTTEPCLAAEFERQHEAAVSHLEHGLERFRDRGQIAAGSDVRAVAVGIEGLAFSLAFVEQLIYQHRIEHVRRVAREMAVLVADGLRDAARPAAPEPGVVAVRDAIASLHQVLAGLVGAGGATAPDGTRGAALPT